MTYPRMPLVTSALCIYECEPKGSLSIAKDIDLDYANALNNAVKNKLNILCYDCKFSSKGIKLNNRIKFKI